MNNKTTTKRVQSKNTGRKSKNSSKAQNAAVQQESVLAKASNVLAQPSALQSAIDSMNLRQSALVEAAMAASQPSALQSAIDSMNLHQSALAEAAMAASQPSAMQSAIDSMNLHQSALAEAAMAASQPSALQSAIDSMKLHQSALAEAAMVASQPSALQSAIDSMKLHQSALAEAAMVASQPATLQSAIDSMSLRHSAIIKSFRRPLALEKSFDTFSNVGTALLSNPNCLSILANSIENIDVSVIDASNFEAELEESVELLSTANDENSFWSTFFGLSINVRGMLCFFFMVIFLPVLTSITANLLTPEINSIRDDWSISQREKVNEIKNLPFYIDNLNTSDLRFITGNNVRLREAPSTKSEILDELVLGQVVTILSKKRNWIEVNYQYEDGEYKSGWVFTRYTARFVF